MTKKLTDLTVTELKAACFDIDQDVKQLQQKYSMVCKQLEIKYKEEDDKKE